MLTLDEFVKYFEGGEFSPSIYYTHDPVTYDTLECASCSIRIGKDIYVIRYEVSDIVMYKCVNPIEEMMVSKDIKDCYELDDFIKEACLELSGLNDNTQYNELLELAKRLTE